MAIFDIRQVTQARVVTQILTRASTTITAVVTLGGGPVSGIPDPVTTADPAPPAAAPPPATSTTSTLTNEQLGAILGSVIGFVVILLPLCYCCLRRRPAPPRRHMHHWHGDGYDDSSSDDVTEIVVDRQGRDAWAGQRPPIPVRQGPVLVPAPPRIPPMRHAPYRQTRHPQIGGTRRYP
ncbi:hypothetical protein B0T25DRAFT_567428 [Lasiosphaeria hispida]|uniref:Uncharacterized protein n=1 Tax=Lasiosphaeria hispida TaxID=260671 RepID=A0AAJ0HNU9_9PEZI|nr:hypothetical protein B0T25DRAFT_567428 [Lasiosphaeria hispida]